MPRIVALDLGTGSVKATVWNVAGRKSSFVERLLHPVPQDGTEEPGLEQQLVAVAALLEDHPELTAAGTVVAASYGGRHVSVHRVTLPFTDKRQIEKTLPFAVEAEVPFDLDDMVLGWRPLGEAGEGTDALVTLVEEEALRATLEGLAASQVEPRQVFADKELLVRWASADEPALGLPEAATDPDADADADGEATDDAAAALAEPPASPVIAVLDVGHTRTVASVVRDGHLLGSRVMDVGGSEITRAIRDGLRCSWANAERLKHGEPPEPDPEPAEAAPEAEPVPEGADEEDTEPGVELPDLPLTPWDQLPEPGIAHLPVPVQRAVEDVVQRLLAEVRSTLIGFEDSLGVEVDEVRLGGGSARLTGLQSALAEDLGVPVTWATGTDGQPIPCEYLLADALAEKIAGEARFDTVDLRTGPLRWRSGFNLLQALLTYGGALILFFTVALGGLYVYQSWSLSAQIDAVQADIDLTMEKALGEKARSTSQAMAKMRQRIDEAEARAAALGTDGKPPTLHTIYELSTSLPGPKDLEIDVTQMTVTPRVLTFEAEVPSYAAADQVEVSLQGTERFETCTKSGEQQSRGRISFNVSCEFDAADGEEG